jgi:hypothetical protein
MCRAARTWPRLVFRPAPAAVALPGWDAEDGGGTVNCVALEVACAVASGGAFLKWQAAKPRSVLIIDGEMRIADAASREPPSPDQLRILAADLHDDGLKLRTAPRG